MPPQLLYSHFFKTTHTSSRIYLSNIIRSNRFVPAVVSGLIALIGALGCIATIVSSESEGRGGGEITAAAVHRVGATAIPTAVSQ